MSRSIKSYARPKDLDEETKQRIQDLFPENIRINWETEELWVYNLGVVVIPMETLGKMSWIMQQHCVTVRKPKKSKHE